MVRKNCLTIAVVAAAFAIPFPYAQLPSLPPPAHQSPPPPGTYAIRLSGPDTDGASDSPGQADALGELVLASDGTVTGTLSLSLEDDAAMQEACTVTVLPRQQAHTQERRHWRAQPRATGELTERNRSNAQFFRRQYQ
jgi:hypothetical protein